MKLSLKELKMHYKKAKKLLKTLKRFYKNGIFLEMLEPLKEITNAERLVKEYKEAIDNYEKED